MSKRLYSWVVLGCFAASIAGCTSQQKDELTAWSDIGSANDMAAKQAEARVNRGIPKATEMPPGLGEDLPIQTSAPPPMSKNE